MLSSGPIDLNVWIDGGPAASTTSFLRSGTGMLCLTTEVPGMDVPELELQSVYAGTAGTATRSVHVLSGPQLHASSVDEHHDAGPESSWLIFQPRACVYDHARRLIDALSRHGAIVRVDVHEQAFEPLERVA